MSSVLRKLIPATAVLLAVFALSACGDSHTKVSTGTYAGESGANAPYLDVGPLVYEVQLSRELNPADREDGAYLQGIVPADSQLESGEEWFGVFLQVYNHSSVAHPASNNITITDTRGNKYTPLETEASNPYTYRAGTVPPKEQLPPPNSIAIEGPTQGALMLFKIKVESLANRPLELKIVDPDDPSQSATAELDV